MLWQWWLCLTLIYGVDFWIGNDRRVRIDSSPIITRTVGLFVPVGFLTALFSLRNLWFPCFLVIGAVFAFVVDRWIRRVGLSGWRLIASCLATLFVATFIVDLAWYFSDLGGCFWPSWQIFRGDLRCGKW